MKTLNTELKKAFLKDDVVCYLIKSKSFSGNNIPVTQVMDGWFVERDKMNQAEYREESQFSFAGQSDSFADELVQTSYIAYGVPDSNNQVDVYEISPDAKTKTNPDGASPFWKVFARRDPKLRFTIPIIEPEPETEEEEEP